jgi:hypothetical protein
MPRACVISESEYPPREGLFRLVGSSQKCRDALPCDADLDTGHEHQAIGAWAETRRQSRHAG